MDNTIKLSTYVTLNDIMGVTRNQLLDNETLIKGKKFNNYDRQTKTILTFNTLIATGNHVINVLNDESLIKTDFDSMAEGKNILLTFNLETLAELTNRDKGVLRV